MEQSQISLLNSHGVAALRQGNLPSAANLFRRALEGTKMQSELVDTSMTQANKLNQATGTRILLPFSQEVGLPKSLSKGSPMGSPDDSLEQQSGMYIHSQGILFADDNLVSTSTDPLVRLSIGAAIIIYNLAVVEQVRGLQFASMPRQGREEQECTSQEVYTQRARSLYSTSRNLLLEACFDLRQASGIPLIDFLIMATSNNAGYAAFVQGDYTSAQDHFEHVEGFTSLLRSPSLFQLWDAETLLIMDHYASDFLLNTLVLRPPSIAAAA